MKYITSLISQHETSAHNYSYQESSFNTVLARTEKQVGDLKVKIDTEKKKIVDIPAAAKAREQTLTLRDQDP